MDDVDGILILLEIAIDSLPSTRTVVECNAPVTGYAMVSKQGQPIYFDMDYHFWLHGVHHYGSEILPTANGQFWKISILSPTEALHLQQKTASLLSGRSSVWRTWPEPNEDLVRILQDNGEEELAPPPPNLGPLTFHDEDEWIQLGFDLEQFEDPHIDLTVHGLCEEDVGLRRAHTTTLSLVAVESALQGLWPHLDHLAKKVYMVKPQPSHATISNILVILEFYDIWNLREFAPKNAFSLNLTQFIAQLGTVIHSPQRKTSLLTVSIVQSKMRMKQSVCMFGSVGSLSFLTKHMQSKLEIL